MSQSSAFSFGQMEEECAKVAHMQITHTSEGESSSDGEKSSSDISRPTSSNIRVRVEPLWEDMPDLVKQSASKHQTLFGMGSDRNPIVGTPPNLSKVTRLCASITSYMKPRFVVIVEENGRPTARNYSTRTTVVNATTKGRDDGSCDHCKNVPSEKRPVLFQWRKGKTTTFSEILGCTGEEGRQVLDIKIGCLSGTGMSRQHKGHKHDFMLKTEIIGLDEEIYGFSLPIQMGSKYIDCTQRYLSAKKKQERLTKHITLQRFSSDSESDNNSKPAKSSKVINTRKTRSFAGNCQQQNDNRVENNSGASLPPLSQAIGELPPKTSPKAAPSFSRRNLIDSMMNAEPSSPPVMQNQMSASPHFQLEQPAGPIILPPITAEMSRKHSLSSLPKEKPPSFHVGSFSHPKSTNQKGIYMYQDSLMQLADAAHILDCVRSPEMKRARNSVYFS